MVRSFTFALALTALPTLLATPSGRRQEQITPLSSSQINSYTPFTFFASAAYCHPATTLAWNCGSNCEANSGFVPKASGGNDIDEEFWYVGYDPSHNTVIVAHQGSDASTVAASLNDADVVMQPLNPSLFPGVPSSVEVHSGFADSQSRTATNVLSAVQKTLSEHDTNSVTLVGHSVGGAVSLLDSVYLSLHLPSSTSFKTITYGLPRSGNQAWADYVDSKMHLTHINNKEDPVPILPGQFLGYHHSSGEIHIEDNGEWVSCPGQDNTSNECIVGAVPNIFEGNISDHEGPYNGVTMGC